MDHYLDIHLLPDPEFSAPILMNALFAKLHRALVQLESTGIGVSFPEFGDHNLGKQLRLHGQPINLEKLMSLPWLKGMRDHIETSDIGPVPEQTGLCRVQRVQTKSNAERLRRRYLKRHPEVAETKIEALIPSTVEKRLALPYVRLKSTSSGQDFLLFIDQTQVSEKHPGIFNTYGLSGSATLPWF